MKWKISTIGKVKAIGALAVVFLLVLATNMMDKHHFQVVKRSLASVYKDRLVAKDNIYKVSRQLQIKRNIIQDNDKEQIMAFNASANDSIESLLSKFAETELTTLESQHLGSLQKDLKRLYELEKKLPLVFDDTEVVSLSKEVATIELIQNQYTNLFKDLDALSQIQLDEGRRIIAITNRVVDTSDLISKFEIGALIAIGIAIQFLILYKPLKYNEEKS